jgi:hypothetical protein
MSLEEPTRIFPPTMIEPAKETKPRVWRVADVEIDELVPWVSVALQKRWPRLAPEDVARWFKCLIGERRALLVRTENCVGLAEFDASTKEPLPTVSENFIRAREGYHPEEPLLIHRFFLDWAVAIGAVEYRFKVDSEGVGNVNKIRDELKGVKQVRAMESRTYVAAILKE